MEPPPSNKLPPDRARDTLLVTTEPSSSLSAMTAVAVSLPTNNNQLVLYSDRPASSFSSISSTTSTASMPSHTTSSGSSVSAPIEKLSRPMAFDKVNFHFLYTLHVRHNPRGFVFSLNKPSNLATSSFQ